MPRKNTTRSFENQVKDSTKSEAHLHEQLKTFMEMCKDIIVMGGFGERLDVKQGCLYVRRGKKEPIILNPGIHGIKKIIWVLSIGYISMFALNWLREEKIALMVFEQDGHSYRMTEGSGDLQKIKRQYTMSEGEQLAYSRYILKKKFLAQAEMLKKHADILVLASEKAVDIEKQANQFALDAISGLQNREQLLIKEAKISKVYFEAWGKFPVNWSKYDIDAGKVLESWKTYNEKQDPNHESTRQAQHPIHAMFNFAYGVLAVRIRLLCVARDLEIDCGFWHVEQNDNASLVYDLIEPARAQVDELLLSYLAKNSLNVNDFSVESTGVIKLTPHFAKLFAAYIANGLDNASIHTIVDEYCEFLKAEV